MYRSEVGVGHLLQLLLRKLGGGALARGQGLEDLCTRSDGCAADLCLACKREAEERDPRGQRVELEEAVHEKHELDAADALLGQCGPRVLLHRLREHLRQQLQRLVASLLEDPGWNPGGEIRVTPGWTVASGGEKEDWENE